VEPENTVHARELRCPRCGSTNVKPKGFAVRKWSGLTRIYICQVDNTRFRADPCHKWKAEKLPKDLVVRRLSHSLRELKDDLSREMGEQEKVSLTTLHREIQRRLQNVPTWTDLLMDEEVRSKWGRIMGVDTTPIKIGGKPFVLFYAVDIPSKCPLAWEILPCKSSHEIEKILLKVRESGYYPTLIITDLAQELIKAVKTVFPESKIQGCLFHLLNWLNERLPIKKRGVDPETRGRWIIVKRKILSVALAPTSERRKQAIGELQTIYPNLDERAKDTVINFIQNLASYHTFKALKDFGCSLRFAYNNVCERGFEEVKLHASRMKGFRKLESTRKYLDAVFVYKLGAKKTYQTLSRDATDGTVRLLLECFAEGSIINLKEISEVTNISLDSLRKQAEECGFTVASHLAFTQRYIKSLHAKLLKNMPTTLGEAMKLTGFDFNTLNELLPKIGFMIKWDVVNPIEVKIYLQTPAGARFVRREASSITTPA